MSGKSAKDLFVEAVEMPGAERGAFLDRECAGDAALRERVERLLAAHEGGGEFMGRPSGGGAEAGAAGHSTVVAKLREGPGTKIGAYKLLQQIGEGGFGVVFMAEQEQPVRRRVALKIIKLGMDTRAVIARFEAERQALAMMDHPNIARVFDAGSTETGRPYFVMELVKGVPITEYADTNNLSTRERLELFVPVCRAVQHAHQKGIIHRDIKPANVLVTLHDGEPVAKVIDFGIAKAMDHRLTEKTVFTEFRQLIGTPEYMSPEQAEMSGLDVDTRSDVYSLGVLLYELLTGTTPFDAMELRSKAYDQIQKMIREVDPPRPSVRISTLGETLTAVAGHRKVEAGKLSRLVKGDLDWIVMRCLEKDRTRRYDTASDLAADVGRHLGGEAVEAAPPGVGYRVRKFVRRNSGAVIATAIILGTLSLGIAGTTIGFVRADSRAESERLAKLEAQKAAETAKAATAAEARATKAAAADRDKAQFEGYVANIQAADMARTADLPLRVRARLDACAVPERGWEWGYLNAMSDQSLAIFQEEGGRLNVSGISPDGRTIVAGFDGLGTTVAWDRVTGHQRRALSSTEPASDVKSIAFSSDGRFIVKVDIDGTASLWNASTLERMGLACDPGSAALPLHAIHAAFSRDGSTLAALCEDQSIRLWRTPDLRLLAVVHTQYNLKETKVALSADGSLVAAASVKSVTSVNSSGERSLRWGEGGPVQVWDVNSGEEKLTLLGHRKPVESLSFSPDGSRIVAASRDGTVRVWSATVGNEELLLNVGGSVQSVAFSSNGASLLTRSGEPSNVSIWDAVTGARRSTAKLNEYSGPAVFSPDAEYFVVGDGSKIRVLNTTSGKEIAVLCGHSASIIDLQFSSDGALLFSTSRDGTVRVWDLDRSYTAIGDEASTWPNLCAAGASFGRDDSIVLVPHADGSVRMYDSASKKETRRFSCHEMRVLSAVFDREGDRFVTASFDKSAAVWNSSTGARLLSLKGHSEAVASAVFSMDQTRILTVSFDNTARLWDARSGEELVKIQSVGNGAAPLDFQRTACLTPDGLHLVCVVAGAVVSYNANTGTREVSFEVERAQVFAVLCNSRGDRVCTLSSDSTVRLWNLVDGSLIASFPQRTGTGGLWLGLSDSGSIGPEAKFSLFSGRPFDARLYETRACRIGEPFDFIATFSKDGRHLAALGEDGRPIIVDCHDGRPVTLLEAFDRVSFSCAAFNPDSSRLVAAASDGVHVWDTVSGRELLVVPFDMGRQDGNSGIGFSPDGTRLICVSWHSGVEIWDSVSSRKRKRTVEADKFRP